ncbi:MAG: hypothetical protein NTX54_01520 [Chloroflexi bacterium]|nr:hypothetical protein [Chloroflexota bacterium]
MSTAGNDRDNGNLHEGGSLSRIAHVWESVVCRLEVDAPLKDDGPEAERADPAWSTMVVEGAFGKWDVSRDRHLVGPVHSESEPIDKLVPRVRIRGQLIPLQKTSLANQAGARRTVEHQFDFQVTLEQSPAESIHWSIEGNTQEALHLIQEWRTGASTDASVSTVTTTVDALDPTPVAFVQGGSGVSQGWAAPPGLRSSTISHIHHAAVVDGTGWIVSRDRDGDDDVWALSIFLRDHEGSPVAGPLDWRSHAVVKVHVLAGSPAQADVLPVTFASYIGDRTVTVEIPNQENQPGIDAGFDQSLGSKSSSRDDGTPREADTDLLDFAHNEPIHEVSSASGPGSGLPFGRPFVAAIARVDSMIQGSPIGGTRLAWTGFWFGMVVYAITRLWRIDSYPISFDGDEAGIVALSQGLLDARFRDGFGIVFPIFFPYPNWNPDVGVYVHLITSSVFGVSVTVARATAVLLSAPTPIAIALTLKIALRNRAWWLAPLVVAALPVWFHLSRSAYDSATWVAFYACFICSYFVYRYEHPRFAWLIVLSGALTFYSNAIAHLIIVASIITFFGIDFRYHRRHLRQWRYPSIGAIVALLPLLNFLTKNPGYLASRTNSAHPFWASNSPALVDVGILMARSFLIALDPRVWFSGIERTKYVDVTGYHNYYPGTMPLLPLWLAPFIIVGVACLARPRFRPYRWQISAMLAVTLSPSLIARFAPTRSLAVVVPVTILALVGIDLVPRALRHTRLVGTLMFIAVATTGSYMVLQEALTTQSTRRQDYGGYGIQWGSQYVFKMVNAQLESTPGSRVMVTTDWNWGGHHFINFFISREDRTAGRVFLGSLDTLIHGQEPWGPELWAVMSPAQLEALDEYIAMPGGATGRPRITSDQVTAKVLHPDGTPGFLMVRLLEAPDVRAMLAAEREARRKLSFVTVAVDGERAVVGYTNLDDGAIAPVFARADGALARLAGPNPAVLDVAFGNPRPVRIIRLTVGASLWRVTAHVFPRDGSAEVNKSGVGVAYGANSVVEINLDAPVRDVARVRLEINQLNASDEDSTVHLYRVEFR